MKKKDIKKGDRYGQLVVMREINPVKYGVSNEKRRCFLCRCSCGVETSVVLDSLTSGNTKSCGCLAFSHRQTVGGKWTPEYRAYTKAKARCLDKNDIGYKNYGNRGIKFLFNSFEEFLEAIGKKPSKKHSIDRINTNSHYKQGNVRWATMKEQQNNRRNNIKYKGENALEASRRLKGCHSLVWGRIKNGWSVKRAFSTKLLTN